MTAASLAEGASFTQSDNDPVTSATAVWRDPQLDQVLSAHHGAASGEPSFASHGNVVRNVLYETP